MEPGILPLMHGLVRILQLIRLACGEELDLTIETVMLRHGVAVLRRQLARPTLNQRIEQLLAGLSRVLSIARRGRFVIQPEIRLFARPAHATPRASIVSDWTLDVMPRP